jgi:hypothetical protein
VLLGAATVGVEMVFLAAIVFIVVIGVGLWVLRFQSRQFPKGWDRTGWEPRRDAMGWLATKFTWLSGGRG